MISDGAAMANQTDPGDTSRKDRPDYLTPDRVSTTRAMVFYATGALIGLAIGGVGLFNARGTATNTVPPEDLALVNQVPILRSDFSTQLETETGVPFDQASRKDRLKVLDEMLREELLVQRGLELNFAETDQSARNALVSAVEQQAIADVTTSQPTEEELRKQYEDHRDQYATEGIMTVHDLLLADSSGRSEAELRDIAAKASEALRGNAKLEDVESRFGMTETKFYDEDFYFAGKIHLGNTVYAKVVSLDDGQISEPIQDKNGFHVVQMVKNVRPMPLSFERSRAQVLTDFKNSEQARLMNNAVSFLRNRAKILIANDYVGDYNPDDFLNAYTP
jgi:PPIC-type PPIASE domain